DVVVLTRGEPHVVSDRASPTSILRADAAGWRPGPSGVAELDFGGGGDATRIICGKFELQHEGANALLVLLPRVLHARARQGSLAPWVDTTLRLLDREVDAPRAGADVLLTRLADVLFVQVLRCHLESAECAGLLAAVADPIIGRALALVHEEPAGPWTAAE